MATTSNSFTSDILQPYCPSAAVPASVPYLMTAHTTTQRNLSKVSPMQPAREWHIKEAHGGLWAYPGVHAQLQKVGVEDEGPSNTQQPCRCPRHSEHRHGYQQHLHWSPLACSKSQENCTGLAPEAFVIPKHLLCHGYQYCLWTQPLTCTDKANNCDHDQNNDAGCTYCQCIMPASCIVLHLKDLSQVWPLSFFSLQGRNATQGAVSA